MVIVFPELIINISNEVVGQVPLQLSLCILLVCLAHHCAGVSEYLDGSGMSYYYYFNNQFIAEKWLMVSMQ